jgi:hypothetical protein
MNENPIIECFAVAENKLLDAIDRQRSRGSDGHNNNETIGENRGKISPDIGANKFAVIDDDTMDISRIFRHAGEERKGRRATERKGLRRLGHDHSSTTANT